MKLVSRLIAVLFLVSLAFTQKTINGAGASFPFPIYQAWALDYYKATGIRLNYQSIGSGGGVRQITNRTVEFGASDAPVKPEKLKKEKLLQFPAIIGGVVPIINVPGVQKNTLKLSSEAITKIFMGEITHWNDKLIAKENPNASLPNKKITTVKRSDGSGTTAIFTNYLASANAEFEKKVGVGKSVKWPKGGVSAKGNEGVANYVKRIKNSIGYVEYAYAKKNNLSYALLQNKEGHYVAPTVESFKAAAAYAEWKPEENFYLWMVNAPGKDSWPVTGASFILLGSEKAESNKKVTDFYDWCFKNGDQRAIDETYIPLPVSLKDKIRTYWSKNIH